MTAVSGEGAEEADPTGSDQASRRLPWRRIWAEAPVIIFSILLAFSIEAWWQRAQGEAEVVSYLTALRTEFEAGRQQLDSVSLKNHRAIDATLVLVNLTPAAAEALSPDSAATLYWRMMVSATFDPSLGVLDALQAAGALDDVESLELRAAIGGWPGLVADSQEDTYPIWETSLSTVERWSEIGLGVSMLNLSEGLGGTAEAHAFVRGIARDSVTRSMLAARAAFNRVYQSELDGLRPRIHEVLSLIESELGR